MGGLLLAVVSFLLPPRPLAVVFLAGMSVLRLFSWPGRIYFIKNPEETAAAIDFAAAMRYTKNEEVLNQSPGTTRRQIRPVD